MAKNLELFYFPASFYSQKARMFLEEKGATYSLKLVSLLRSEQLSDCFLEMNPAGQVPVLKADGLSVPGSEDIYRFGEENIAGDNLSPSELAPKIWALHDELETPNIVALTFACGAHPTLFGDVHPLMKKISGFLPTMRKSFEARLVSAKKEFVPLVSAKLDKLKELAVIVESEEDIKAEIQKVDAVLEKCARQLDQSDSSFLFGGTLTIADIDLAVLLLRLRFFGLEGRMWANVAERRSLVVFMGLMERRSSFKIIAKDASSTGSEFPPFVPFVIAGGAIVGLAAFAVGLLLANRGRIFH